MFTGIVEELGDVVSLERDGDSARLAVRGPTVADGIDPGESISVNGCCLTVVDATGDVFTADVMAETLHRTSLGQLAPGSRVNLERPVTLADRLGGHLVQGHIDGVGTVLSREHTDHWDVVTVAVPADLLPYIVVKGSLAVDGVSLTVSGIAHDAVSVSLIPTTLSRTTLGRRLPGHLVNLEVDIVAKYVERLLVKER